MRDDPRLNGLLQQAIELKNAKRYEEAAEAFAAIAREYPECAPAHGLRGGLLYNELKRPADAIACFREAVRLAPKSELASLGLFHTLWATDQRVEALEEIKRYQVLTNWSCQDYIAIVNEIKAKWLAPPKPKTRAKPTR